MNWASVGIAFALVVFVGNAISDGYTRDDTRAQDRGADPVLLAGSGDNPWALPNHRRQGGRLPEYITNPKYATEEDIETKLDYGKQDQRNTVQQPQPVQPGYGAPLGLPAVPHIYTPYGYGYQPGYPAYPGMGTLPGMGVPYTGDTGFGGNPMVTPYGNIYGNPSPSQGTQPSSE